MGRTRKGTKDEDQGRHRGRRARLNKVEKERGGAKKGKGRRARNRIGKMGKHERNAALVRKKARLREGHQRAKEKERGRASGRGAEKRRTLAAKKKLKSEHIDVLVIEQRKKDTQNARGRTDRL